MIEGDLVNKEQNQVLILCGGIGYRVHTPTSIFENISDPGEKVRLYTHLHVREDQLELFGFFTEDERDVFVTLLTVSGVGPRLALTILSSIQHNRLIEAIERKDIEALSSVSGVGKKTAQRLIVDLTGKLPHIAPVGPGERPLRMAEEEAIKALMALGYYPAQARKAVLVIIDKDGRKLGTEELTKRALSRVNEMSLR